MNPYIVLLGLFVVAGIAVTFWGWRIMVKGRDTKAWPSVEGVVETFTPASELGTEQAQVHFTYQVNGETLKGVYLCPNETPGPVAVSDSAKNYPVGAKVPVFYNPEKATDATLEPGGKRDDWFVFAAGIVATLFGTLLLLFGT